MPLIFRYRVLLSPHSAPHAAAAAVLRPRGKAERQASSINPPRHQSPPAQNEHPQKIPNHALSQVHLSRDISVEVWRHQGCCASDGGGHCLCLLASHTSGSLECCSRGVCNCKVSLCSLHPINSIFFSHQTNTSQQPPISQ